MAPLEPPSNTVLANLRLDERKAFELCAIVLDAFRRHEANPHEKALKDGLEAAHNLARRELETNQDDTSIASFLSYSLARVIRTINESAKYFPLSGTGQEALASLKQFKTTLTKDANLSCQMTSSFIECHVAAQNFYSAYLKPLYQLPEVSLRIDGAEKENDAFPGRKIAFNGSVRYEDKVDMEAKRSIVRLTAHPLLNGGCLPALPYILMHEILCHWPQMSRSSKPRPNPREVVNPFNKNAIKFEIDPFSEGWMDSLVGETLRRHFGDINAVRAEEAKTAEDIHDERTQYNRHPVYEDASRIAPGAAAARLVRWFFAADDDLESDPITVDYDFWSLSCQLNTAAWTYEERTRGCNSLILACRAFQLKRDHNKQLSERHATCAS